MWIKISELLQGRKDKQYVRRQLKLVQSNNPNISLLKKQNPHARNSAWLVNIVEFKKMFPAIYDNLTQNDDIYTRLEELEKQVKILKETLNLLLADE